MKSPSPSLLPFVLAAVALIVSVFALWQQPAAAGPLASPAKSQDLIDVQRRLAALEAREPAAVLRTDLGAATSVQRAAVPDPRLDDLLRRVALLEAQRAQPTSERGPTPVEAAQAEAERLQRRATPSVPRVPRRRATRSWTRARARPTSSRPGVCCATLVPMRGRTPWLPRWPASD